MVNRAENLARKSGGKAGKHHWVLRPRRVIVLVAAVLMMFFAVGCSPANQPVLAVVRDGASGITLLFSRCTGYRVDSVSVFADVEESPVKSWDVSGYRVEPPVDSVQLFQTPRGWRTDDASLASLTSGVQYRSRSTGRVGDRALNGGISFTLDDLGKLGPDDVLVADGGERNKAMGRDEFLAEGNACSFG